MEHTHTGTCSKCGKTCSYRLYPNRGFWVHDDTGKFLSAEPAMHDCNTYIVRDEVAK
jgi:hypothetical protein